MRMPDGTVRIKIEFRLKLGGRFRKENGLLFLTKSGYMWLCWYCFGDIPTDSLKYFPKNEALGKLSM